MAQFFPIFGEKICVFLRSQCHDQFCPPKFNSFVPNTPIFFDGFFRRKIEYLKNVNIEFSWSRLRQMPYLVTVVVGLERIVWVVQHLVRQRRRRQQDRRVKRGRRRGRGRGRRQKGRNLRLWRRRQRRPAAQLVDDGLGSIP
jgi:hypothetical protein